MTSMRNGHRVRKPVAVLCAVSILLCHPFATPVGLAEGGGRGVRIAELTPQAELAINNGLKFLARTQAKDGGWDASYRSASTALALMAFMLQGHFPKHGKYGVTVARGLDFLLKQSKEGSGYFGKNMYQHALATLALSEIWGMSDRDEVRDALKTAVGIILRSQSRGGGWRYRPYPLDADLSVTVMQIVALHSAKEAGMYVPQKTIDRAMSYVRNCQDPFTGGFGYKGPGAGSFACSAAGTTSLLMCDMSPKDRSVQAGLGYLFRYPNEKFSMAGSFFYAHYYAIQAMYQAGEAYYQKWYPKIHDELLKRGSANGSWRSSYGSAYGTSIAILILGVPYRFLPVYQR